MAVFMSVNARVLPPTKRRRTATSVLAGDWDPRPPRDALTSLLNGVPIYKEVEAAEEIRRGRKRKDKEREGKDKDKEREKDKKRAKPAPKPVPVPVPKQAPVASSQPVASSSKVAPHAPSPSPFWMARPAIHIANPPRSISVTPPPISSPPTTPGPSISSGTSATSSKRPHTPADDDDDTRSRHRSEGTATPPPLSHPRPKKKRAAVRKGWKGWVEGSPPPSEKLINLDVVTVLEERKTRSGKSFDAIGVGKDSWV